MRWNLDIQFFIVVIGVIIFSAEDVGDNVEANFNRHYVNQKLEYGRGRIWQDVQQKVKMFVLGTDLSGFKLDDFIYVLDIINRQV